MVNFIALWFHEFFIVPILQKRRGDQNIWRQISVIQKICQIVAWSNDHATIWQIFWSFEIEYIFINRISNEQKVGAAINFPEGLEKLQTKQSFLPTQDRNPSKNEKNQNWFWHFEWQKIILELIFNFTGTTTTNPANDLLPVKYQELCKLLTYD